jgi:hypothetical protein
MDSLTETKKLFSKKHFLPGVLTMESYGGNITYQSKENQYTEFLLSFPVI